MLQSIFARGLNAHAVCDAVAVLLVREEANQRALAEADAQDPEPLRLRVYADRTAPISDWIDVNSDADKSPIINVRLERSEYVGGNVIEQQRCQVRIGIECFAVGYAAQTADGFTHADAMLLDRLRSAVGFVRKVLMAGENTYLGMRGVVSKRWIDSEAYLPLDLEQDPRVQHVRACKLSLVVDTYEVSPQTEATTLGSVRVRLIKQSDGQVLASSIITAEE